MLWWTPLLHTAGEKWGRHLPCSIAQIAQRPGFQDLAPPVGYDRLVPSHSVSGDRTRGPASPRPARHFLIDWDLSVHSREHAASRGLARGWGPGRVYWRACQVNAAWQSSGSCTLARPPPPSSISASCTTGCGRSSKADMPGQHCWHGRWLWGQTRGVVPTCLATRVPKLLPEGNLQGTQSC